MRDLATRLRDVVKRDRERHGTGTEGPRGGGTEGPRGGGTEGPRGGGTEGPRDGGAEGPRGLVSEARELTYVPDPDPTDAPAGAARALGGVALDPSGSCIVVDRRYDADRSHGRRRIEEC